MTWENHNQVNRETFEHVILRDPRSQPHSVVLEEIVVVAPLQSTPLHSPLRSFQ